MAQVEPDWNDPCAALAALKPAYYQAMAGGVILEVRFGTEWTKYSPANFDKLEALILRLEASCAKAKGERPKRFAFRLGAYR